MAMFVSYVFLVLRTSLFLVAKLRPPCCPKLNVAYAQVCLPARGTSQATGKKCTVTGYGYMGESEFLSRMLFMMHLMTIFLIETFSESLML